MGLCGDLSEIGQFGIKLKVRFNFTQTCLNVNWIRGATERKKFIYLFVYLFIYLFIYLFFVVFGGQKGTGTEPL